MSSRIYRCQPLVIHTPEIPPALKVKFRSAHLPNIVHRGHHDPQGCCEDGWGHWLRKKNTEIRWNLERNMCWFQHRHANNKCTLKLTENTHAAICTKHLKSINAQTNQIYRCAHRRAHLVAPGGLAPGWQMVPFNPSCCLITLTQS